MTPWLPDGEWEDAPVPQGENIVRIPLTREEREASFDRALARLRRNFDDDLPAGQLSLEREQRPR